MSNGPLSTLEGPRPATRIGRYLLFPGGWVVKLSRRERLLYALGFKRTANLLRAQRKQREADRIAEYESDPADLLRSGYGW